MIEIDGIKYKVIETLPYHGIGKPSKMVKDLKGDERIAVKERGKWRFWTVQDRLGIRK